MLWNDFFSVQYITDTGTYNYDIEQYYSLINYNRLLDYTYYNCVFIFNWDAVGSSSVAAWNNMDSLKCINFHFVTGTKSSVHCFVINYQSVTDLGHIDLNKIWNNFLWLWKTDGQLQNAGGLVAKWCCFSLIKSLMGEVELCSTVTSIFTEQHDDTELFFSKVLSSPIVDR